MTADIRIPIVFSIDRGFVMQATVSIYSLLQSAGESVYDIYIIIGSDFGVEDRQVIISQVNRFKNHTVRFIVHGDEFEDCAEYRGITTSTYYRLLIPWLLPQYDKVIYADADIIFNLSLDKAYHVDLAKNLFGAVPSIIKEYPTLNSIHHNKDIIPVTKYHNAGFLLINSTLLRKEGRKKDLIELSRKGFKFQDQDVINIFASGRIYSLSHEFSLHPMFYKMIVWKDPKLNDIYDDYVELKSFTKAEKCNIHYCGQMKPWKEVCYAYHLWWQYYRQSVAYDPMFELFHYDRIIQEKNINEAFRGKLIIKITVKLINSWLYQAVVKIVGYLYKEYQRV